MKYLKNRQEFLTEFVEYKESYNYKSEDFESSTLVKEALENDITWGGSLLGRLINSTIRKAVIGAKVTRVNPLIKKLKAELESIEGEYLNKEKIILQQAKIYALFERIKKSAMKPDQLDVFLKNGGLIDQLVEELDEISEFPEKEALKTQIEQFRKDLEELQKSGEVETETDEDEEDELEVGDLKEKIKTSVVEVLKSVISLHNLLKKTTNKSGTEQEVTPEEKKFKIGGIYTYTNKKGERKKAKLVSFTNQVLVGNDKQFITKDDVKKGELAKPSSVFVEFLDDFGKSLPSKPAMEVDISTLSIDSGSSNTGGAKKVKVPTNEDFIFESIEDPKAKSAYNNLVKYDKSSNIGSYIKILQSIVDGSKTDQKVGFEWAGIIWPTEGSINSKIISFGKQLVGNLKTSGKPLESNELLVEATQFNDVTKSISLFCRPILGFKSSPEMVKLMGGLSDNIQSIIGSFDSMIELLPKLSEEKSKKEKFMSSYKDFIKINEADENEAVENEEPKEEENLIFKAYRKNFSEENESIWIASEDKKSNMESKFKNLKINIDTSKRIDPIVRIANIFGDAYKLFATPVIPSGRPNGRVSQKTFREYKYLGKGTGKWSSESGPDGPFAVKSIYNKWEKGVMSIIEDTTLRKIFANPNLSINGNPGAGQTLFTFMNDMLEDDTLKDYDAARRRLLTKYFNIPEDKGNLNTATPTVDGKKVDTDNLGETGGTQLNKMTKVNITKSDIDQYNRSYLLIRYISSNDQRRYLMLAFILGTFMKGDTKIVVFKYQVDSKGLFKYLESMNLKVPEDDIIKRLQEKGKIKLGFIEEFPIRKNNLKIKSQDLDGFISEVKLDDEEIKIEDVFTLNTITKDKKNNNVMKMVKVSGPVKNNFRPQGDKSIKLSDIKDKYKQ